jgi:hypothetical protein
MKARVSVDRLQLEKGTSGYTQVYNEGGERIAQLSEIAAKALGNWLLAPGEKANSAPTIAGLIDAGYLEAPEAWDGKGLPPIGAECAFLWDYQRQCPSYAPVRVLAHDGGAAIVRVIGGENKGALRENLGGDCGGHPIFRPIRTAEQIAAEMGVGEIYATLCRVAERGGDHLSMAQALYEAGARMPGEGKEA